MQKRLNILIIDNSYNHISAYIKIFEQHGNIVKYKQIETEEAFQKTLEENSWNLIISEIKLPKITALTALEILKEKKINIPFIIITTRTNENIIIEHIKKGADNYLLKKNLKNLNEIIQKELTESELRNKKLKGKKLLFPKLDQSEMINDKLQKPLEQDNWKLLAEYFALSKDLDFKEFRKFIEKEPEEFQKLLQKFKQNYEDELSSQLWVQKNLDKINKAIQGTNNLKEMMSNVLNEVLSIFNCDRAFLLYPCDPETTTWSCPMERTRPEYPGVLELGLEIQIDEGVAKTFSILLNSDVPVKFGEGNEYPLPLKASQRFNFNSLLSMAIYPQVAKPWQFGIHQCSYARVWNKTEEALFEQIGRRLTDGLTSLITFNNLKESEERFRRLAENAQDIIYRMAIPEGIYEYISPACLSITGYSPEEFYKNPKLIKDILHPNWQKYFDEQWENLVKGELQTTYEFQIVNKSGELKWLNQRNIFVKDDSGNPIAIEGIVTDITERKLTEETLREKDLVFRNLAESSPGVMGMFYNRPDGTVCMPYTSPQIENLYGLSSEDVRLDATTLLNRSHPDDIERVNSSIVESARTMTHWHLEFRVLHPTRGELWLEGSTNPKPHPDGGVIWYGFIHDITKRKKAEKELNERIKHSQSLLRLSKKLESASSFDEILDAAFIEVNDILRYKNLWIYLLTEDKNYATVLGARGSISKVIIDEKKAAVLSIKGDRMLEEIAESNEIIIVEDARSDERTNKEIVNFLGNVTIINIPIILSERLLGSVGTGTFGDEGIHVPTHSEQEYLRSVASHLAHSISRVQLFEERNSINDALLSLNRKLRAISNCNQTLLRLDDEQILLNEICRIICDEAGYRLTWVGYAENDEAKTIRPVAWAGYDSGYIEYAKLSWDENNERGRGPAGTVIRTGQIIFVQDFETDNQMEPWRESALQRGYHSGMAIPLKDDKSNVFGVLLLYSAEKNVITEDEIKLMEELAGDMAFGITTLRTRTLQERTAGELLESEKRYRLIAENTADTIAVFDLNFKPIFVSPSVLKLRGFTAEETLEQSINQILTPESVQKVVDSLKEQLALEMTDNVELLRTAMLQLEEYCKDGSVISIETSATFIRDENQKPISILTITRDITARKQAEQKLLQSEHKYRELSESSPYNIILYNIDCTPIYANRNAYLNTGFNLKDLIGKPLQEDKNYPTTINYIRKLKKVVITGNQENLEMDIPFSNNKIRTHSIIFAPEHDDKGNIVGVIAIGRDITEYKLAEMALRESQKKYKDIIEYSPIGIYQSTLQGEIIFANNQLAKILGYDSSLNILNLDMVKDIYYDPSERIKITSQISSGSEQRDFDLKWKKKDGSLIWVTNSVRIKRDDSGNIQYFEGFVRDIDERKKIEIELIKLYAAVEQSSATIVITDVNGNIEYANPKFNELTGYTIEEVKGKNPRIISSGNHPTEFYKNMWETINSGKDWYGEIQNKRKNGELFWEYAVISPIKNNDGLITNFVAIKEDISEKKKILQELVLAKEKAEEMNKVKSIFFANMSHELRTPFVGILGYADLLSQTLTDPETKEMAVGLLNTSKRMKDTLTKILNLSKLEFNEVEYRPREIEVAELINTVYKQYLIAAQNKNLSYNFEKNFESLVINTDDSLLTEVLNNLINNAIIYTNEGEIIISAEKQIKNELDLLIIKVRDTGIGIPEEKQGIIWEEFRQVSEGTTRNYQGTGLGLSIAKKYMELLGGKINLESEVGKGTTFILEFIL
ncbi:MAG: PAS domain S-box protein [Melioribacteraceae bacterium]